MTRARDISNVITDADLAGNIDVDGTANLDVVDIDGAVDMASTLTVAGAFTSPGIDDNADANAITIDSSERVGIGNTTPDGGKLHVTNSTGAIGYFQSTQASANVENIILNSTQTNSSSNLSFQINDGTTAKGQVRLNGDNSVSIQNGTSLTERLRIDGNGNVIIGETTTVNSGFLNLATSANPNPLSMLCRSTTDSHECGIIMQKSSTDSGNFAQTADNEALGSIKFKGVDTSGVSRDGASIACVQNGTSGSSVPSELIFHTSGTEAMRIESDGQLSVGGTGGGTATIYVLSSDADAVSFFQSSSNATSGIKALQTSINQNAGNTNCQHLRATTQNVGTFRLDGNGASTFTSDERLKKNIETTRDGYLEDIAKLRVVKYNWHCHDEEDKKELGLIAQEVQKVFPKLVVEDDEELNGVEKPLAVKLSVLPMILLKALQEANTKITTLEARIKALEGA